MRRLEAAPEELTRGKLRRVGEGVGKVVFASEHWVVKRERGGREVAALIILYKALRRLEPYFPFVGHWLERPSRRLRLMRVMMQGALRVTPQGLWFTAPVKDAWMKYHKRSLRGEKLAEEHLAGTPLVPEEIEFPETTVRVSGWPGRMKVTAATERVEATLFQKLAELAGAARWDELEQWLERFLELRQRGWKMGLFSVDPHLKNFGVIGDRIVLLDSGGVTDRWGEIERRLEFEHVVQQPHVQLGLAPVLGAHPEIAARFDKRWKAIVNRGVVERHWPAERTR
ncbi:MAG: hypothetical protein FJW20_05480 [Acidimicrobiia bacterium]|nr:hypothetical protein [Acidimicrobiia bacterium]